MLSEAGVLNRLTIRNVLQTIVVGENKIIFEGSNPFKGLCCFCQYSIFQNKMVVFCGNILTI